jgi:hypothetical protein
MKKLFVAASLLVASLTVNAQDDYKPVSGNVTAELGLSGGLVFSTSDLNTSGFSGIPQLKFRYFFADDMAVRIGLNLSKSSTTNNYYEAAPGTGVGTEKISTSTTLLNLGVEKHLAGTDRLSTFVGADFSILMQGAKEEWDNFDGASYSQGYKASIKNGTSAGVNASSGIGFRLVFGAEYYFIEKVFLGAEFGWGFLMQKDKDVTTKVDPGTGTTTTTTFKSPGKVTNIAPNSIAAVKIGFRF